MWFKELTGFKEKNGDDVRANIKVDGSKMTSLVNGKTFECGTLEIPNLKSLKESTKSISDYNGQLKFEEVVGNVMHLHLDPANEGAVFQAASQFNLLEMVSPSISPESGIDQYEDDRTQGPVCAITCGAGTIFRNYFVPINDQIGQTTNTQIDCLNDIGIALGNKNQGLWEMKNGYALANRDGLIDITNQINNLDETGRDDLKDKLKVGIQWNTEVTKSKIRQLVTQVYCSALPVSYSRVDAISWTAFAKLILEATYEATFYTALKNLEKTGNNKLYLTLVGGGAFGNNMSWILDSIQKAVVKFSAVPLDVKIVSYGESNYRVKTFVEEF